MRPIALALALSFALVGCVKPDAAPATNGTRANETVRSAMAPPPPSPAAPTTGSLAVRATMTDGTLLADVAVLVANDTRLTGPDGVATFDTLAPGRYDVTASKPAHRLAQASADVVAGRSTSVDVVLPLAEGANHAHAGGVFAHRDVYTFHGHFDCSATYLIVTGDCAALLTNVSEQTGAPDAANNATSEKYLIPFAVDRNWTALVAEMRWSANASTPATGEDMTLAFEPARAPADGHAAKYAYAEGPSPLRVRLDAGKTGPNATAQDKPDPQGGEELRARAYVAGLGHHPGGTDFLGVGAAAHQDFDLFVTIFYGEDVPAGYTALR